MVSLFLLALQRKTILAAGSARPALGAALGAAGLAIYGLATLLRGYLEGPGFPDPGCAERLSLALHGRRRWPGSVAVSSLYMERHAFRQDPFCTSFSDIHYPHSRCFSWMELFSRCSYSSAEVSDIVFRLAGVSYHRTGLVFEFPNVAVEVAEQCSGIRSSLSLFILSVITGYLFLKTVSRRVFLSLAIFPITVVKNAFRIVTITLLANFVDMRFLTNHWIHSSGGIPFFAVALALFVPLVWLLKRTEKNTIPLMPCRARQKMIK